MAIREDTTLAPGVYLLPDGIRIESDNVTLDGAGNQITSAVKQSGVLAFQLSSALGTPGVREPLSLSAGGIRREWARVEQRSQRQGEAEEQTTDHDRAADGGAARCTSSDLLDRRHRGAA